MPLSELTRNGSQNIWDEHVHQGLVEKVVALFSPAQNRFKLAEHHQAGLGQTLLGLIVSARGHEVFRTGRRWGCFINITADGRNRHSQAEGLGFTEPPERFPKCLHESELKVDHNIQNGL